MSNDDPLGHEFNANGEKWHCGETTEESKLARKQAAKRKLEDAGETLAARPTISPRPRPQPVPNMVPTCARSGR